MFCKCATGVRTSNSNQFVSSAGPFLKEARNMNHSSKPQVMVPSDLSSVVCKNIHLQELWKQGQFSGQLTNLPVHPGAIVILLSLKLNVKTGVVVQWVYMRLKDVITYSLKSRSQSLPFLSVEINIAQSSEVNASTLPLKYWAVIRILGMWEWGISRMDNPYCDRHKCCAIH